MAGERQPALSDATADCDAREKRQVPSGLLDARGLAKADGSAESCIWRSSHAVSSGSCSPKLRRWGYPMAVPNRLPTP
jgi:hypothetical protein